ncbi:MAG: YfaZ family outer membrane protein [Pseudomonadota bacterium]
MFRIAAVLIVSIFANLAVTGTALAQDDEALDVRPSLMWLSGDTNVSVFDDSEYDSFLGKGELWSDNWGVSANLLQNDDNDVFGLPRDSEYFNLDVKRRFGKLDKSNFELGLGWQQLNIESQLEASGPKLSLSGRLNLKHSIQLYGATSYFPELEDNLQNNDATAYEVEAGVLYQPLPSVSLKAGYRVFSLDLEDPQIEELGSSSGFLLGTDWSW